MSAFALPVCLQGVMLIVDYDYQERSTGVDECMGTSGRELSIVRYRPPPSAIHVEGR